MWWWYCNKWFKCFYNFDSLDAGNIINTYFNFKGAGAGNDWCFLRQIGGSEAIKLTFDFLDDVDARFCIRSINPYTTPNDTVTECFTVDNGNVSCTGTITNGSTSNMFAGGLRLNGSDQNTLYNDNRILGITTLNKIIFNTGTSLANYATRMAIDTSGNIGIGTQTQSNILQVGDGARLRISNGISDYTVIGTKDVDDATNTRIVISGNTRGAPYAGNIDYVATSGNHIFYTSGTNERMRITNAGNISCTGSIGCVGISTSGGALFGTSLGIKKFSTSIYVTFRQL